jgi:Heparinase II/III N-terminus/Heparinase II/III-like protein
MFFISYTVKGNFEEEVTRLIPRRIKFSISNADYQAFDLFCEHRFDLLGAGWVKVCYDKNYTRHKGEVSGSNLRNTPNKLANYINKKNRRVSWKIRQLITEGYNPIDWQIDFKSGYRWSEKSWYRSIKNNYSDEYDIKVPWELSRLQHLPELAVAYSEKGEKKYLTEFRNQVLDWMAANPPRFGVNWVCTMDVAIRAANLLVAYDLFCASEVKFDNSFVKYFTASIYNHAQHIAQNLEWSERRRANHYLANICGLLISAIYLPANRQTDAWLAFTIQELMVETERQFLKDGGHFEASTNYHRLCGEMVTVCAVMLDSLSNERIKRLFVADPDAMNYEPKLKQVTPRELEKTFNQTGKLFPTKIFTRLFLAVNFTRDLIKPNGSVAQIGDNDGGRFLRLGSWMIEGSIQKCRSKYQNLEHFNELPNDSDYVSQNYLNHYQWLAWASALFGKPDWLDGKHEQTWGIPLILAKALVKSPVSLIENYQEVNERKSVIDENSKFVGKKETKMITHQLTSTYRPGGDNLLEGITSHIYPDFGVYIIRSNRIYLVIRCGNAKQDGCGVHAHEDQLAVELFIDGEDIAVDPGTYVYTSSQPLRNIYRSSLVHVAPSVVTQSVDFMLDKYIRQPVFSSPMNHSGECITFSIHGFTGKTTTEGGLIIRRIILQPDHIEIKDEYMLAPTWKPASNNLFKSAKPIAYSPSYGVRLR